MEKKQLIDLIRDNFDHELNRLGFEAEEGFNGYSYVRDLKNGCQKFGFDITSFDSWHRMDLSSGSIQFYFVDRLLNKLFERYQGNFHKTLGVLVNKFMITTDTRDTAIHTENDFIGLVPVWKKDIEEKVLPFFDQWSDLKKINDDIIDKLPTPEIPNYIPGETSFKRMIIMKLCNNPNYNNYIFKRENTLFEAKKEDTKYKPYYDLFMELKSELENIQPIY